MKGVVNKQDIIKATPHESLKVEHFFIQVPTRGQYSDKHNFQYSATKFNFKSKLPTDDIHTF